MRSIKIPLDGIQTLAGTLFEPKNWNGCCVQINSAMAVEQHIYYKFARFLSDCGLVVVTYDYRGMGKSRITSQAPVNLQQWGREDIAGVGEWLKQSWPQATLLSIGHSLGGQLFGFAANNHYFQRSLNIASGVGYWGHFSWPHQLKMLLAWYALIPLVTRVKGHLPGRLLGGSIAIPSAAAFEWRRWCTHSNYFCDRLRQPLDAHFHQPRRMGFMVFADDQALAPLSAVEALQKHYTQAQIETWVIHPSDFEVSKIGHFGFFSSKAPMRLWQQAVDWLIADNKSL